VDRPIVTVRATLPGAAPETMDAEVTSILESAVARVAGVRDIFASSEENSSRIRIEFSPGADLDVAAADVREAVNQVTRSLPDRVEDVFVTKADNDAESILTVALIGEGLREDELSRILDRDVEPELLAVDGVASLNPFGKRQTQMRVVIDPLRLNRFGLTTIDLANALQEAPFDIPVGSFGSQDQELIVRAEATAATPELIRSIVISGNVRVGDVADVRLGPEDPTNLLRLNGEPVIGGGVVRRAQSNTIQIADAVLERVDALNARLDGAELRVLSDESVFIRTSVQEVITSVMITVAIVVLAIWVFLGSWKATLIPAVAIPVALIGTIAGIWLLCFSINLITLLALVLATGLIVDDSIVVLENVQRQQAEGLDKSTAARVGTQQVFFAVIATTVVLVAVFIPISFLPSTIGRLFREFGFVLALAVTLSSFVALTLGPAIASKFDFKSKTKSEGLIQAFGNRLKRGYGRVLSLCLAIPLLTVFLSLGVAGGAYFVYQGLDQELVPSEDRGRVQVFARGPDGVGLTFMERQADDVEAILQPYIDDGSIESVLTIVGRWDPNVISSTATLAPWDERTLSQQDIVAQLRGPLSQIPGVRAFVFGPSSLPGRRGGGNRGGSLDVAITGADYQDVFIASRALVEAIEDSDGALSRPTLSYQPTQPQLSLQIERSRAADLGVPLDEIAQTLRTMVDGQNIVDLNVFDESIPIVLEGRTLSIQSPEDLLNLFVRSTDGALIPLSGLTNIVEEGVAAELERVEQRRAIEMEVDIADGVPLPDAIAEFEAIADEILPERIGYLLQGDAETLNEANRDLLITYGFALVIIFLAMVAH
ncbi:MAG: efflux RND transporter permease subunit, partial [Pseudomonadota bacterium]